MTPAPLIARVVEATDLRQLVNQYVPLRHAGSRYVGSCPFHQERTASFGVNPAKQIFKCFGCGKGGDALDFLQAIEGIPFREALQRLATAAGIQINDDAPQDRPQQRQDLRQARALALEAQEFQRWLIDALDALGARLYADLDAGAAFVRWCDYAPLLYRLRNAMPEQLVGWHLAVRGAMPGLPRLLRDKRARRDRAERAILEAFWAAPPGMLDPGADIQDLAAAADAALAQLTTTTKS